MANIYDIPVQRITGEAASLADYRGKVLLIVNVASQCGLTPQYDALEKLYSRFKDSRPRRLRLSCQRLRRAGARHQRRDLDVLHAPPTASTSLCSPRSPSPAPTPTLSTSPSSPPSPRPSAPLATGFRDNLNSFLATNHNGATTNPEPGILWNFEKFLIDRNGNVVARFSPEIVPDDPIIIAAIESALA